ncbi:hypothetical protein [Flavobacterium sp.]|uniref:hypothetical protein n=1 Tax=Flavobacterium sp. TaxID=239 RepID=UPI0026091B60|nr:hypothetical protein [Flavobacterium sp.]
MKKAVTYLITLFVSTLAFSQESQNKSLTEEKSKISLNESGSASLRFIALLQTWVRHANLNPGSLYKEQIRSSETDFSVRRLVLTSVAQINPEAMVLVNLSASSNSGENSFQQGLNIGLLDAYGEYKMNKHLFIGAGLHQWTGLSRLNVDGVGSIINLDHPLFQQVTWNRLDRLGRMMGIYAKGEFQNLNYRISINQPFTVSTNTYEANTGKGSPNGGAVNGEAKNAQLNVAYHNPAATSMLIQGYFEYNFWEKENHVTPYETNTYHGEKRLLNIGSGFIFRNNGMLTPEAIEAKDPAIPESPSNPLLIKRGNETDLFAIAVDATVMYPFSTKLDGVAAYFAYYHIDLGANYYTVSPVLNITTAGQGASSINGSGTGFPSTGTGDSFYTKLGYITPKDWFGTSRIGVFGTYQYTKLDALLDPLEVYEAGVNWFIKSNKIKFSVLYRNRPIYTGNAAFANQASTAVVDQRKDEIITQLQFNF